MCSDISIVPAWTSSRPSERERQYMVPGRLPPDDPREWLNRARSSLTKAREGAAFPETRYPGAFEPVTQEEFEEAVRLAEGVLVWAQEIVDPPPPVAP